MRPPRHSHTLAPMARHSPFFDLASGIWPEPNWMADGEIVAAALNGAGAPRAR